MPDPLQKLKQFLLLTQAHYSIWDTESKSEKVELFTKGCYSSFEENRTVLTESMARSEALRCMRCDRNSKQ